MKAVVSEMAERTASSEVINVKESDAVEVIHSMTDGRGADVCVDAVGMEAERSLLDKAMNRFSPAWRWFIATSTS
jgi:S-(hydroxymethyl)glutathione dehydrogenase / alcohol dehydrogenase